MCPSDVKAMAGSSITSDIVSSYSIKLDTSTKLLGMAIMFHVSMILPIQLHVKNINLKISLFHGYSCGFPSWHSSANYQLYFTCHKTIYTFNTWRKYIIELSLKSLKKTHVLVDQSCTKLLAIYILKSVGTPTFGQMKGRHLTFSQKMIIWKWISWQTFQGI